MYNQQGLGSIESHNMIIWMCVSLELVIDSSDVATGNQPSTSTCSSGRNSVCLWKEGAPSSPEARRPILLAVGKEDKDLLNKLVPPVDAISSLQSNGVTIAIAGQEYSLKVKFI